MQSRAYKPVNKFSYLEEVEDEESEDEYKPTKPVLASPPRSGALTPTQKLEEQLKDEIPSLVQLAEYIGVVFGKENRQKVDIYKKFENYDSVSYDEYEECMKQRLRCFESKDSIEFQAFVTDLVNQYDHIEARPLINVIYSYIRSNRPFPQGHLYLLGVIAKNHPYIIVPSLFEAPFEELPAYSPVICWVISASLQNPHLSGLDPLISHQIIDLFLPAMMNRSIAYSPMSVCAVHLIRLSFENQKVYKISAHFYSKVLYLTMFNRTNRDKTISSTFLELLPKLEVANPKDLAAQLLETFPDPPPTVFKLFIDELKKKGSATFVDGWASAHSMHKEASMKVLVEIIDCIPEKFVTKFPVEDLENGGDRTALAALRIRLSNASFRMPFMIALVALAYYLRSSMKIF